MRILALAALLIPAAAGARTNVDEQAWVNATVIGGFGGKGLYFVEAQPRFTDEAGRLGQLLLRGALGLQVTPKLGVYVGYLHLIQPIEGGKDRNEERPFIQLSWSMGQLAGGTLSTRTRFEHRDLSTSNETSMRVRSMIRWSHKLAEGKRPKALLWSEPFLTLKPAAWSAPKGLDQIRTFAGLEIPLAGKSTLEAGYMNQYLNDRGPNNRMNHIASFTLFVRP